ncbi:MAG: hypothetical protein ABSB40_00425 [Nitrososphaeria archaeon]
MIIVICIIFILVIVPFIPGSVEKVSISTVQEKLYPVYTNSGFEDAVGEKVNGWNLLNGSKLSRTIVYDGNNAINMTPSNPSIIPQIIYVGNNATTRYIIGGNVIASLAVKALNALNGSKPSYLNVESVILYIGPTNVTTFLFNLVLYRNMPNVSEGVAYKNYGIIAYKNLENSDDWFEYSLQMSQMTGAFSNYLSSWKGIDAKPTDRYEMLGLSVWCDNLVAYVDDASIYLIEPEWIIATMKSNSIIPMNVFLSDVEINGSTPTQFYTKPNLVTPFSTFDLYTFVPYTPSNGSVNIVTVRFGTGQTIQFQFKEETRRVWVIL